MPRYSLGSVAIALCCSAGLPAQTPLPASMDVTVGLGYGGGGHYSGRAGVDGAITLVPRHRAAGIVALAVGGFNSLPYRGSCRISYDWSSDCTPARFPTLTNAGLLGGLESVRSKGTFRALLGPSLFYGRGRSALGGLAQVDAVQNWARFAFVITVRGSVFPRAPGETLRLISLGLGVRVR